MRLIATMPLRNEAWIVGLSSRVVLMWADHLVCLLHASTDRTAEIIGQVAQEHPGRVTILTESDPTWREMDHRQRMLTTARGLGATHIALTDADEVLTGDSLSGVRDRIAGLHPTACFQTAMSCMWRSLDRYRIDGSTWAGRRDFVLAFADAPSLSWRPVLGYDHHQRNPLGSRQGVTPVFGGVMHLQWASWRRLTAKHAWYQMHERLRYPTKPVALIARTYARAPDERGLRTAEVPASWWKPYRELRSHVDLDAEPWHEAECCRLLELHGRSRFAGLNLHGVDRDLGADRVLSVARASRFEPF